MTKRKRKEMRVLEPCTQLSITEFMTKKHKLPEIKLELADKNEKKKIKLDFEDKEKNTD